MSRASPEEHPVQCHPQGLAALESALENPRWLTEDKEQDPIPTGTHTSSIPKIRGRGRQPSCLIPVRNHLSLLHGTD